MSNRTFRISGTGCALVDYLYTPVNFASERFKLFLSVNPGDGGLSPGKLVFRDEFEKFSGEDYLKVREEITNGNPPVTLNIGGPSIVSLIHAAQMLAGMNAEVCFYGSKGMDQGHGERIFINNIGAAWDFSPEDLDKAIALGVVSGGYACFYHGGTFYEKESGEKKNVIESFYHDYLIQLQNNYLE